MRAPVAVLAGTGLGLLMAALPALGAHGPVSTETGTAAALAAIAVLAATVVRPAATLAVLLVIAAIALGDPEPLPVAVSGGCAAGYLVLRHTGTVTAPTVVAAAGLCFAGWVATLFPLQLPWLPLLAPPAAFGCYLLAVRPFLAGRG